jgi:hypothetical protein
MSLQKSIFAADKRFYCASCAAPRPHAGHRSGIPLGWCWHLNEQVFTCDKCNGVTVDAKMQTATKQW